MDILISDKIGFISKTSISQQGTKHILTEQKGEKDSNTVKKEDLNKLPLILNRTFRE